MERVSLYDRLRLVPTKHKRIRLFCNWRHLCNENNLAFKAASLIRDRFKIASGLDIYLHKNIPQGGGLGGASSDAAAVILGLNKLFDLKLDTRRLFLLGGLLGSDVNFFLSQSRFAHITGRGERVRPIKSPLKLRHSLIFSGESVSTARVYQAFSLRLTKYVDNAKLITSGIKNCDRDVVGKLLFNSLTKPFLARSAKGKRIFDALSKIEDCPFFLSGSGSTIAVILSKPELKRKVKAGLKVLKQ